MVQPLPRRQPAGRIFLAAALTLAAVVVLSVVAVSNYASATALVDHAVEVRQEVDTWLQLLIDAETGARGYVGGGDPDFLAPYHAASARERRQAALVRTLIAAEGGALAKVDDADGEARATMAHLGELVGLADSGRRPQAIALLRLGGGKQRMDTFRQGVAALRASEAELLADHRSHAAASARRALIGAILLVLLSCGLVGLAWQRERAHGLAVVRSAEDSNRRLAALSELAAALAEARTTAQVARVIVDHGMRAAGADTCTLYQLDEGGRALDLIADRGVAPEVLAKIRRITDSEGNPDAMKRLKAGEPLWAESQADYGRLYPDLATTQATRPRAQAFWSVPLIAEGQSLGLLGVGFYSPRRFSTDERSFVVTLAGHCAQALLRASRLSREDDARRWLATTLRSIGDAVIATDAQGLVTFMNPIAEELTGWVEADARGRPLEEVFSIFSEQTRAAVESPVTKVLREGAIVGLANHTVLRSRRGGEIPIDDSGAPIRAESGEIRGVVLVFRDVSREKRERARAEFLAKSGEVLVSSIDYQATLATVARFAVPTLADWCSVELVEPGAKAARQVAVAHVDENKVRIARELGERYPPDPDAPTGVPNVIRTGRSELYGEIPSELLERAARDDEHRRIIRELQLNSGMVVPLRVRERIFGALTFVFAESGRRYNEDDLSFAEDFARRAAMAIENAMALKEAESARAREQVLRSEAELANRAKDEFLATVSHELRTPLNAILGWTVLLRRRNPPLEMDKPLATIERNARLQTKLIEDVLDISRIISGKLVLNVGPLKIRDVIDAAVETVAPAAAASEIRVTTEVPDQDLGLVADPDRLQQVVWNLLSNAVKFTPRGGQIDVRAARRGPDVCVTVADTGEGIRRSVLPFLFEPFRQADASTARRHGGLGLGLAIVRQLVLAHGGTVRADSEGEGKGAIFTVLIPERAAGPAFRGTSAVTAASGGQITDEVPRLDRLRLLIVDDERDALTLLSEALGDLGAEVHAASSAREALDALARIQPQVLVSDISMPDMDGLALMREVRRRPGTEGGQTPAIALTAFTRDQDVQRALAVGYQLHLSKPVDLGPLAHAILRLARP